MTHLGLIALIVHDYDAAIAFFVDALGFEMIEDVPSTTNDGHPKRWVVVRPPGAPVQYTSEPRVGAYGGVVTFLDIAGNTWHRLGSV